LYRADAEVQGDFAGAPLAGWAGPLFVWDDSAHEIATQFTVATTCQKITCGDPLGEVKVTDYLTGGRHDMTFQPGDQVHGTVVAI
jgi:hypothetical protein